MSSASTLYGRTIGLVVLVVLSSLGALAFVMSALHATDEREAANLLETHLFQADISVRNFLLTYEDVHARRARSELRIADELAHQLESNVPSPDLDGSLHGSLHSYERAISALEEALRQRGLNEDSGLEGEFRKSALAIEELIRNTRKELPNIHMLATRRSEKDYLLRGKSESVAKVHANMGALIPVSRDAGLSEDLISQIEVQAESYLRSFDELVALADKIEASTVEVEAARDRLVYEVRARVSEKVSQARSARIAAGILLGFALLLGAVFALWTARWIVRPIDRMQAAARDMVRGQLPAPVAVRGNRTIRELAEAINRMSEHESKRRDAEAELRSAKELAETGSHELESTRTRLEEQISALSRTVDELRESQNQSDVAARAKSAFIANMSHEIRTPLNGIVGFASLLEEDAPPEKAMDYGRQIRSSGEALLQIVNDVLDFSSIEADLLTLELAPFRPFELAEKALDFVAVKANRKGIQIAHIVDPSVPEALVGDSARLRQILVILLGNAVKFTSEGRVLLHLSYDTSTSRLLLSVRDSGTGIEADCIENLFKPFNQADQTTTPEFGGSGLGLSIAHRLVHAMDGEISVDSTPGAGSTFAIQIPAATADIPAPESEQQLADRTIVILGLSDLEFRSLATVFTRGGADVIRSKPAAISHTHDLYILPASRIMEARSVPKDRLILLLDGAERPPKGIRSVQMPPTRLNLLSEAAEVLAEHPQRTRRAPDRKAHGRRMRMLLAEDNRVNQKVIVLMLERLGYQIDVVDDGKDAVEACRETRYDVVLMDLHMPRMDGLEATRNIREEAEGQYQPVIVAVTAYSSDSSRKAAYEAGMDDFMSKPLTPEELKAGVERAFSTANMRWKALRSNTEAA